MIKETIYFSEDKSAAIWFDSSIKWLNRLFYNSDETNPL